MERPARRTVSCCMSCKNAILSASYLPRLDSLLSRGWSRQLDSGRDVLIKRFEFKGFKRAFAFMEQCANEAIRLKHHPEWTNVYNRVDVTLTTHAVGNKVTDLDIELAESMEQVLDQT